MDDKHIEIRKIIVFEGGRNFEATISAKEHYRLVLSPKTMEDRSKLIYTVAKWMEEKDGGNNSRRISANNLSVRLNIPKEKYVKKIYEKWVEYTNKKRITRQRLFKLYRLVGKEPKEIKDIGLRLSFAKVFFMHEKKEIDEAYYWLGDYKTTKIGFAQYKQLDKQLTYDLITYKNEIVPTLIHSKGAGVLARELHFFFKTLPTEKWNKIEICGHLLNSIHDRIAHHLPGETYILDFLKDCINKNLQSKLSYSDVEKAWDLVRGKDHELLRKEGILDIVYPEISKERKKLPRTT